MRTKSRGSSKPRVHPVAFTDGDNRNTERVLFALFLFHRFCLFICYGFYYLGHVCVEVGGQLVGSTLSFPLVVSLGLLPSYLQEKPAPEFVP